MRSSTRVWRLGRFLVFRFVPAALLLAIIWMSFGLAQSVVRWFDEQTTNQARQPLYAQTATALAPSLTPAEAALYTKLILYKPVEQGDATPVLPAFATNTPSANDAADVPVVTPTPEAQPQATATLADMGAPPPLPTVLFLGDPDPNQVDVTAIPTRVPVVDRQGYDLFNVLLMGSDGEITGDGFVRTDTMIVVSINRSTNTVSMLSLPRDLFVYIPAWSMQRINLTYARGESGGWNDGTFELLRQMILYNLGINVHYYAMIDLTGFKEVIDVLGGIDVAVDCAIEDLPLIGAEVPDEARRVNEDGYYVLDVGYYHFDGPEALWYARSRYNSTDFDRGRRQQQILRAIWRKALDTGQLTRLPELWGLVNETVDTNLGFEDVVGLLPIALNLDPARIENFALVRTYHTTPWQTPDGDYVQLPVYDTLRPLLEDFYQPPTDSQTVVESASVRVLNGTENSNWDRVAAERLGWDGIAAFAAGTADRTDYVETTLIDYTGESKGGIRGEIAGVLNINPANIRVEPSPDREVDYEVVLGSSYNSCTFAVLPVSG